MTAALTRRPALEIPLPAHRRLAPPPRVAPPVPVPRRRPVATLAAAVVLSLATVLGVGAGVSWLGGSATATSGPSAPSPVVVVAEAGDTYWALAAEVHAGGDLRSTVDALVAANGGRELRAGDRIVLAG